MKTIALYSIKGGVGKTAVCVNLAYLARSTCIHGIQEALEGNQLPCFKQDIIMYYSNK